MSSAVQNSFPSDPTEVARLRRLIHELARMDPQQVIELASSDEASGRLDLAIQPVEAEKLLRPWNEVRRASSKPLGNNQYDDVLLEKGLAEGRTSNYVYLTTAALSACIMAGFALHDLFTETNWLEVLAFAVSSAALFWDVFRHLRAQQWRLWGKRLPRR